jgi:hypothetical protein
MRLFDVEQMWQTIIAVILAAMGGLARLLNARDKTKLKWSLILSELFISAFAGLMVLMLARSFELSGDWLGLVCGMAGWIGPRVLDLVFKKAGTAIGIDVEKPKETTSKVEETTTKAEETTAGVKEE